MDFACAALYFGILSSDPGWWMILLLYNACAFAMQMPMGLVADELDRNLPFASVGILLIAVAFPLASFPLAAAVIAGLGNGAFHVGAGLEILNESREASGPLGIFVSPGAIGLYLGTAYGAFLGVHPWIPLAALTACMVFCLLSDSTFFHHSGNAPIGFDGVRTHIFPLIALFTVVVIRSALGMSGAFSVSGILPVFSVLCVAGGKAAGGLLADRFGAKTVSAASLSLCVILLFVPYDLAHLLALFCFNMTMPLTLWAAARRLKGAKGFSFGLLTFALFIGFLPKLIQIELPGTPVFSAVFVVLSLFLLLYGCREVSHERPGH